MYDPFRPIIVAAALASALPAYAQEDRLAALEARLAQQEAEIKALKAQLAGLTPRAEAAPAPAPMAASHPATPSVTAAGSGPFRIPGLDVSGDLRVREEYNFSDADARDRARTVLRARLRATYAITPHLTAGVQLATGDADDPNTTDITLSSFDDDLDASLDQAWIRYANGGLTLYAGKFPQIFAKTELVWDGDVVPQGLGGSYAIDLAGGAKLDVRGMYFVIDEASGGKDSDMTGGQLVLTAPLSSALKLTLAAGYYGYHLPSLAGADAGDFRSNLMAGGRFLSGYRLIDGLATLNWSGLSERWPVAVTADYVRNLGAAADGDTGFNIELSAGRTTNPGDWRIFYSYAQLGVDAAFAAFTHDNLNIATNYRLHGLSLGYSPARNVVLDATFYHYRPLDPLYAGSNQPRDWLDRLRLNLLVNF